MKAIFAIAWIWIINRPTFLARRLSENTTNVERYSVFKLETGGLILVRHKLGIIQQIPDQFTANILLSEHSKNCEHVEISNASSDLFRLFKKGPDIPSLVQTSDSPDEKLRVIVDKAIAIAPAFLFITDSHFLKGMMIFLYYAGLISAKHLLPCLGHSRREGAYNPSFTRWSPPPQHAERQPILQNYLLFSWRTGDINSRIHFGWYDTLSHSITEIPVPEQPDPAQKIIDRTGLIPVSFVPGYSMGRYVGQPLRHHITHYVTQ